MEGMSERAYAAHAGSSRGAIQKAKAAGRLVLHADGSIDAAKSDASRGAGTDPSKQRKDAPVTKPREGGSAMKPVPDNAVSAVGDTLRQQGLTAPATGGGTTFLQAKTAHEVLKAQERQTRLEGGTPVLVRVVPRRADDITSFGDARLWSETTRMDVRVSDITNPRPGDRIEIPRSSPGQAGDAFLIQGEPVRDRERLVWTIDLRPV